MSQCYQCAMASEVGVRSIVDISQIFSELKSRLKRVNNVSFVRADDDKNTNKTRHTAQTFISCT